MKESRLGIVIAVAWPTLLAAGLTRRRHRLLWWSMGWDVRDRWRAGTNYTPLQSQTASRRRHVTYVHGRRTVEAPAYHHSSLLQTHCFGSGSHTHTHAPKNEWLGGSVPTRTAMRRALSGHNRSRGSGISHDSCSQDPSVHVDSSHIRQRGPP